MRKISSWLLILGFVWLAFPVVVAGQPAPSGTFDVEAATDAYLARLTQEEKERSDAYFEMGGPLVFQHQEASAVRRDVIGAEMGEVIPTGIRSLE